MPMTKTFWYDERLVQSVLQMLSGKSLTTEDVARQLGIAAVDALSMLRELSEARRVVDVTEFADHEARRQMWLSAEPTLNIVEEEKAG